MRTLSFLVLVSGLSFSQRADACSGSPPPPPPPQECSTTYACGFTAPKTLPLPEFDPTGSSGQVTLAEFPGFLPLRTSNAI